MENTASPKVQKKNLAEGKGVSQEVQPFEVTLSDYERLFTLLEWFIKPILTREIERKNINTTAANLTWLAWMNTKQMMTAFATSGLSYEETVGWMEEEAAQRVQEAKEFSNNLK